MSLLLHFIKGIFHKKSSAIRDREAISPAARPAAASMPDRPNRAAVELTSLATSHPVKLPDATFGRMFLDCAQSLVKRNKYAAAAACLINGLTYDAALLKELAAPQKTLAGLVGACASESSLEPTARQGATFISVIVCSRDDARFATVQKEYEDALTAGTYEIIRIADASSMAEGYNRGFAKSSGEIVIFCHDDIRLLAKGFRAELEAALQEFDVVGVAGATLLDGPTWFSCQPEHRRQAVFYPPVADDGYMCHIDGPQNVRWHGDIQCLDGLFIAARRSAVAQLSFDEERYTDFHFYDLDFSYRAFLAGLRLAVVPLLGILHKSTGSYNSPAWHRSAETFCRQHDLPMKFLPPTNALVLFSSDEEASQCVGAWSWMLEQAESALLAPDAGAAVEKKYLLHVGCGPQTIVNTGPGFQDGSWTEIRLDADPNVQPDMLGTITDMSAVPDHSVDAVYSSHTLEHLYLHEVPLALAEMRRVLKPDGFTLSWVPDLQAAAQWIAQDKLFEPISRSAGGTVTPFDIVYSHRDLVGRDKPYMAHHCGFTRTTLAAAHHQAGFESVICIPRFFGFDLQVIASPAPMPFGLFYALASLHFQDQL